MKWLWYGASENEQKEKSIVGVKMIILDFRFNNWIREFVDINENF